MSLTLPALYAVVRGLIYAALLVLIGERAVRSLLSRTLRDDLPRESVIRDRLRRLAPRAALVLVALCLIRGVLQVLSLVDPGDPIGFDLIRSVLLSGSWGNAWILQVAAALALVGALTVARGAAMLRRLTLPLVGVVVWAQTGMGHSATHRWPAPLGRILDGTHILGAGLWLGTLTVLMIFVLPQLRGDSDLPALARVVRAFSLYARIGVLLVVLSGLVAACVYARSVDLLLAATWGRLLLIKLAGVAGALGIGWYNWRVVTPALEGSHAGADARLRRAVQVELALAAVMLAITTLLVVSPLPGEV